MDRHVASIVVLMSALVAHLPSYGQEIDRAAAANALQAKLFDAGLTSPTNVPGPGLSAQFAATAGIEQKTAEMRLAARVGDVLGDVRVKGPIDDPNAKVELANLDGLANAVSGDFGIGYVHWNPTADPNEQLSVWSNYLCDERRGAQYCLKREDDKKKEKGSSCDAHIADNGDDFAHFTHQACLGYLRKKVLKDKRPILRSDFPEDRRHIFDAAVNWGIPVLLGFRGKVGRTDYKFAEAPTFTEMTESRYAYNLVFSVGALVDEVDWLEERGVKNGIGFLGVHYRYERSYDAGKKTEVCTPIDGASTGTTKCRDLFLKSPNQKTKNVVQFEWRRFFGTYVALSPLLSIDVAHGTTGIEVPIYFVHNNDGGFNGGVSVGWRSDTDDFLASAFVGAAFDIFPLP